MRRALTIATLFLLAGAGRLAAHCQVPCGIYDDEARIQQMHEDMRTIEKATKKIGELAGKGDAQSVNQAVRWVNTKEEHASRIIETVSLYFLTQKVKAPTKDSERRAYLAKLADHHAVMSAAMKTKQTVSQDSVDALGQAISRLARHYMPSNQGDDHGHSHGAGGRH